MYVAMTYEPLGFSVTVAANNRISCHDMNTVVHIRPDKKRESVVSVSTTHNSHPAAYLYCVLRRTREIGFEKK